MSRKARKFKGFFCPKSGDLQKKKKVFTLGPSRFSPELTQISSRKPDAQLTKGGAMPQFCSLYYAILQS